MLKKNIIFGLLFMSATAVAAPWPYGRAAYDINGNPYTGKAYLPLRSWMEDYYEDGYLIKRVVDTCDREICTKREIINGIPYIRSREQNGVLLNGVHNIKRTEGLYINGVPDGLHKQLFNDQLIQETMYDKGKTLWIKNYQGILPIFPYSDRGDKTEIYYGDDLIIRRDYKEDKMLAEEKTRPNGQLAELSLYDDGKIIIKQVFKEDGTSQAENFINKEKENLEIGQFYDSGSRSLSRVNGERKLTHVGKHIVKKPIDFWVIAGGRGVCRYTRNSLGQEDAGCLQNFESSSIQKGDGIDLSPELTTFLYENPSEFFKQNKLGLDLSDVGEKNIGLLNMNTY